MLHGISRRPVLQPGEMNHIDSGQKRSGSIPVDAHGGYAKIWRLLRRLAGATLLVISIGFVGLLATTNHSFVTTPSMWPTIPPGSMIFVRPERSYKVGDVIEFRANGLIWAHRLIAITKGGDYRTKGDNPQNVPDVFVPPVTRSDIIGKVVAAPRFLGFPELALHRPGYAFDWFITEIGIGGKIAILGAEIVLLSILERKIRGSRKVNGNLCSDPSLNSMTQ